MRDDLMARNPDLQVELVGIATRGDKILDTPLAKIGGKALFVKELEVAMLEGEADIAVHSMKDVPMEFPDGLFLPVICEREDPRDAFVSNHYPDVLSLPPGARVGTASLRRQCQLKSLRPDLPAGGQGAVGIECRSDDQRVIDMLMPLQHLDTADRVICERALNRRLQGGCQVPIACYAELNNDDLHLRGLVGEPDGSIVLRTEQRGHRRDAEAMGIEAAEHLLAQGADKILAELYANS